MITRHLRGVIFVFTGWLGLAGICYFSCAFPMVTIKVLRISAVIGGFICLSWVLYNIGRGR